MKIINTLFRYWESIILALGILYLSFAPPSTFQSVPSFSYEDKLVHLLLYAGLTCVLIFDFRRYAKNNKTNTLGFVSVCLVFPVFLGGLVEILQPIYFAPRTGEWSDLLSDILGTLLGLLVMYLLRLMPKTTNKTSK